LRLSLFTLLYGILQPKFPEHFKTQTFNLIFRFFLIYFKLLRQILSEQYNINMKGKLFAMAAAVALAALTSMYISNTNCCGIEEACCMGQTTTYTAELGVEIQSVGIESNKIETAQACAASNSQFAGLPTFLPDMSAAATNNAESCKMSCDNASQTCCGLPCPIPCCKE
jgi:hypothetical protein